MSLQLTIRFHGNQPTCEYETNLLSHAYGLLESLTGETGAANFLAKDYTDNEEDLLEAIEEDIGEEPEDFEAYEAYEQQVEDELGRRGSFSPVAELLEIVSAWLAFFQGRAGESFDLDGRRHAQAEDIVADLQALSAALQSAPEGRARFVIG